MTDLSAILYQSRRALLVFAALVGVGVYDLQQTKSSVLRNYPVVGHVRFMLESVRPELRQMRRCFL